MMSSRTTLALSLSLLSSAVFASAPAKPATPAAKPATDSTMKNKDGKEIKVMCVNTLDAMQQSEAGKKAAKKIEDVRKNLTDTIAKKEKTLTDAMNDFKTKQSTLSSSAREKAESSIMEMRRDLESTIQGSEDQLKLAMQRATEELSKDIEDAVTQIAQKQGLDLVTDVYTGRPVYASDKMLLTTDLISVMNANYAKAQPTAKAKAA